jgi:hypothetical protein
VHDTRLTELAWLGFGAWLARLTLATVTTIATVATLSCFWLLYVGH